MGAHAANGRYTAERGTRKLARRLPLALSLALLALLVTAAGASAAGLFSKVPGEMFHGRYTPAAGLLPDGKVLIAGGFDDKSALQSAETYDPATGVFEQLAATMVLPHGEQATVPLPDGSVLLVGGWSSTTKSLKTAELFNPATRSFEKVANEMTTQRDGPGAVLLPNGKVFITAGAQESGEYGKTAEIYDPTTRTFTAVKGLALEGRYQPAVALLPNGKVLIAGGYSGVPKGEYLTTAELYDPATETFQKLEGAGHELVEKRDEAGVVTLQNGKVLIAGGYNGEDLATAEVFDYTTNTFTKIPDVLSQPRDGNTGVLLPDGRALFVAGYDEKELTPEAQYLRTLDITSVPAATPATGAASGVGISTANVSGTVLTEARASVIFQFGTSTAYGSATTAQTIGFGAGPQAVGASLTGLSPSTTYHFRVVATNAGGTTFGADQTFTTSPPVPALASVKQSHSRWREGNGLAQISSTRKGKGKRRAPVGTSFSFALNTPAKVALAFTQRVGGRKVRGRCVAKTHRNRNARHCTRTVTRGTLVVNGHAGTNTVKFQGRISRSKKLRPGTYTLVITANGPSGAAAPQKLTFTIVR
jgi:hypothetical protein